MAAAHDQACGRDHAIDALTACEFWIFFDAVDRDFRRAAEYGKDRTVAKKIDGIVVQRLVYAGGLRPTAEIIGKGFFWELHAFKYHVFSSWRVVQHSKAVQCCA